MAITNGYATLDDLQAWLGDQLPASQNAQAETAIETASRWIDRYCGRHFWTVTETRTFPITDRRCLDLGCDIVTLTSLAVDGTVWSPTVYELVHSGGRYFSFMEDRPYRTVELINAFFSPYYTVGRRDRVSITGTWGWPAVPTSVGQACVIEAGAILNRKQSIGGVSGGNEFGVVRVSSQVDPTVAQLLAPYRMDFGLA